jgi:YidC/Oxa1 family membrane protein insertase
MLQRKIQPEMKKIQDKYKGKRDQISMQAMQEETTALYDKYGVSPMGSCVQIIIQMPILFALYRVFYNIPAYLGSVKGIFGGMVTGIIATDGFAQKLDAIHKTAKLTGTQVDFFTKGETLRNYVVDLAYKLSASGWDSLRDAFPNLADSITDTQDKLAHVNYFIGLNISDTPLSLIKANFGAHFGLAVLALLVPICAYASQLLNIKMMPTASMGDNDQMARQMKTMNMLMPLMSLFISFTTPVGLSIYWIAGALVRTVQQIFLNRHFENLDINKIVEKNKEKAAAKAEKRGIKRERMMQYANMSTKSMNNKAGISEEKIAQLDRAAEARSKARSGSMASKANMVKDFNERNSKH